MRVATFNVNGINTRLAQLLAWLERESPDVACLQELKCEDRAFPAVQLKKAGYLSIHLGQRSWNGVAILARDVQPQERRRGLPGDDGDVHSRYLEADVRGMRIACLYLPNGNPQPGPKFDYKLAWFERLIRHARSLSRLATPVVLAGDFNVVPTDADIYDPRSWKKDALLQPASRDAYRRLLAQGWTDALRHRHPDAAMFTFWDYFRNHWPRNAGLRIDHLLLNAALAPRLRDANVDRWVRGEPHASDHAPAWVELDERARGAPARGRRPAGKSAAVRAAGRKAALPTALRPMLATLADRIPAASDDWLYEIKFDGYRLLARIDSRGIRLFTRNGHDWTARLPHLVQALHALRHGSGWFDGEIVAQDATGQRASFQALQNAFDSERTAGIVYYLFDLPYHEGRDLTRLPLVERRRLLQSLLRGVRDPLRFSEAFEAAPEQLLDSARELGLEGIIGKRKSSSYVSRRSPDWIKLKCGQRQEFVIGGWTDPQGSRVGFGALLLGVYDGHGALVYAGKVGTGFDDATLKKIRARLGKLASDSKPFATATADVRSAHWVKPDLVAEIAFSEWTREGHLRHPVFQALRADKPARSIVREAPQRRGDAGAAVPPALPASLHVSHPDRVIDAGTGATKLDVVHYYALVGPLMMEHLRNRPVSLVRAPQGIGKPLFFQKHLEKGEMAGITRLDPALDRDHVPLLAVASPLGLLSAAQMNVIELHTCNATRDRIDRPDRMTFDLDPGEGVGWAAVQEGATLLRAFLDQLGLPAFLKTSGGKGLHVVTPLRRRYGWDDVKDFSRAIVQHMAATLPRHFVAKSGPRNRVGRIYIDYLRNGFGATTVCAWSVRARPGLGVSIPIGWDELPGVTGGAHWTLGSARARVETGNRPWQHYARSAANLTAAMRALRFEPSGDTSVPAAGRGQSPRRVRRGR